jgi:hypothetical protein
MYARHVLRKKSTSIEEKHKLKLMTTPRCGIEFHGKTKAKTILQLDIHIHW